MMIQKDIDLNEDLTQEQLEMLEALKTRPVVFDDDLPELTEEQIKKFKKVSAVRKEDRRKQSVTLRLTPRTLKKARSLGKGYTSILSRILEAAMEDNDIIERYL